MFGSLVYLATGQSCNQRHYTGTSFRNY